MRNVIPTFITTLFLALLIPGANALTVEQWAEKYGIRTDASYDAVRVMETKDGAFRFKERKAPGKSLMEMNMGGMQGTAIIREDLKKSWFVMPTMGVYREVDTSDAMQQQANGMQVNKVEEVGRENVNGYSARKFKTRFKDQNGKGAGFMWITDAGVPIKMDMIYKNRGMKGQRMKMELEELNMRPQDDAHFELPQDVKPMGLGSIMGMAQKMRQNTGQNTRADRSASAEDELAQPNIAEELGTTAQDEAKSSVKNETRRAIRDGIRGLFNR